MANDVSITLYNSTGKPQTLVVFQQDPEINKIFTEVFPTAWRVFNVGATGGQAFVILPIQYQVGAGNTSDAFSGRVSNIQDTDAGQKWKYVTNSVGSFELETDGKQSDNSVSLLNQTGQYVTASLAKNKLPLLTYPEVGNQAVATFLPINYIYFAWYNNLVQGTQIAASISSPQAYGVNLDGANTVEGTLSRNPNTGEQTWAVKVNGKGVVATMKAVGRRAAGSVTMSIDEMSRL